MSPRPLVSSRLDLKTRSRFQIGTRETRIEDSLPAFLSFREEGSWRRSAAFLMPIHGFQRRKVKALAITLTEDSDIAAAATMGDSISPKTG